MFKITDQIFLNDKQFEVFYNFYDFTAFRAEEKSEHFFNFRAGISIRVSEKNSFSCFSPSNKTFILCEFYFENDKLEFKINIEENNLPNENILNELVNNSLPKILSGKSPDFKEIFRRINEKDNFSFKDYHSPPDQPHIFFYDSLTNDTFILINYSEEHNSWELSYFYCNFVKEKIPFTDCLINDEFLSRIPNQRLNFVTKILK